MSEGASERASECVELMSVCVVTSQWERYLQLACDQVPEAVQMHAHAHTHTYTCHCAIARCHRAAPRFESSSLRSLRVTTAHYLPS